MPIDIGPLLEAGYKINSIMKFLSKLMAVLMALVFIKCVAKNGSNCSDLSLERYYVLQSGG